MSPGAEETLVPNPLPPFSAGFGATLHPGTDLEAQLRSALVQARAQWPNLQVSSTEFFMALGHSLRGRPLSALANLHAADLYLALGCRKGQATALEAFEHQVLRKALRVLARLVPASDGVEDVAQKVREHLFVPGSSKRARIEDYRGHGSLLGWTRAAVLRMGLNHVRGPSHDEPDDQALEAALTPYPDPELMLREAGSRQQFAQAFASALAALSPRQRTLLRMHHLQQVSTDKLAALYGTHRVTVSRWLIAARKELLGTTRALLSSRLRMSSDELDSLLRVARFGLETSLSRYLQGEEVAR